jgi:DNA-directed RNA polymerase
VYGMRQKAYVQNRSGNHSERCNVNYKIEIARAVSPVIKNVHE